MNQQVTKELKAKSIEERVLSIRSEEMKLAARIREAVGDDSVLAFSRKCGISETAFRKYLGGAEPSTFRLVSIAKEANVNIAWLATGEGPKKGANIPLQEKASSQFQPPPPLNIELLTAAVEGVQEGLRRINRTVPPDKHAQLIAASYELLLDGQGNVSKNNVINFIRAAA